MRSIKHIGGVAASTPVALAEALLLSAQRERGHVGTDELAEVCRLVLRALRAKCPCGLGAEAWHVPWVCNEGTQGGTKGMIHTCKICGPECTC